MTIPFDPSRRRILTWGAKTAGALLFGGLEFLASDAEARGKRRQGRLAKVRFNYQTILGNNAEDDEGLRTICKGQHLNHFVQQFANQGDVRLSSAIEAVKTQDVTIFLDPRKMGKRERYIRVVSEYKWGILEERRLVLLTTEGFDLPRSVVRGDQTLQDLTDAITRGYATQEEKAQALLCFVQTAIRYDHGKAHRILRHPERDFVRSPQRTLWDRKGECKDTSVLYATLLTYLGVDPVFLLYQDHVNVGVPLDFEGHRLPDASRALVLDGKTIYDGKTYYVAETTTEIPTYVGRLAEVQRGLSLISVIPLNKA